MDALDAFVAHCLTVVDGPDPGAAVATALEPLVADPEALAAQIEARRPEGGGAAVVHRSDALTVLGLEVAAGFVSPPHNHTIWAVVGIYDGNEDNVFYRRTATGIEETGRAVLPTGGCLALPPDAVHRIANSGTATMKALHVYGGDLFATSRSQWDDVTGEEQPFGTKR